jgi:carbon-monoxide dehydrogenase medium subunit
VVIQSLSGTRRLPIDKFFLGPRKNALNADEIVTGFEIPIRSGKIGSIYRRNTVRKALDLAKVGVAVQLVIDPKTKVIQQAAIALGAVAPTPIRARESENVLTDNPISEDLLNTAAELSAKASQPISDVRSNEIYRKKMVQVLTKRCLVEAISRSELPTSGDTE